MAALGCTPKWYGPGPPTRSYRPARWSVGCSAGGCHVEQAPRMGIPGLQRLALRLHGQANLGGLDALWSALYLRYGPCYNAFEFSLNHIFAPLIPPTRLLRRRRVAWFAPPYQVSASLLYLTLGLQVLVARHAPGSPRPADSGALTVPAAAGPAGSSWCPAPRSSRCHSRSRSPRSLARQWPIRARGSTRARR